MLIGKNTYLHPPMERFQNFNLLPTFIALLELMGHWIKHQKSSKKRFWWKPKGWIWVNKGNYIVTYQRNLPKIYSWRTWNHDEFQYFLKTQWVHVSPNTRTKHGNTKMVVQDALVYGMMLLKWEPSPSNSLKYIQIIISNHQISSNPSQTKAEEVFQRHP